MQRLNKAFETFKTTILNKYGENPAKMLIYTGVLGWFLSSAAQVAATMVNPKIPREAKMYIIPQEIGDGAINVLTFFAITTVIKNLGSKLVSTGKLTTGNIRKFLKSKGFNVKNGIGSVDFDMGKILENDAKLKSSGIYDEYKSFKSGVEVTAMTLGSILSCNIVTPFMRNDIAEKRQLQELAKMDVQKAKDINRPKGISMERYINNAYFKHSNGTLKV